MLHHGSGDQVIIRDAIKQLSLEVFQKFRRLFDSVINTRPIQLYNRLRLLIQRKLIQAVPALQTTRPCVPAEKVSLLQEELLLPIFSPRMHLVEENDQGKFFRFLNMNLQFTQPMDWLPEELEIGTRLELLNLHYMEYLEAVDNTFFQAIIIDWIESNPPYRPSYWKDNWNSYSLSIRVVVWMQQYARRQTDLDADFRQLVMRSLFSQLRFLENNLEKDIGGNHLIKNVKALLTASAFFKGKDARRWRKVGLKLLHREMDEQILPDGMHYERSPAYHCQVFADLLECYRVIVKREGSKQLKTVLEHMSQVLADLTHPDGLISLFNDGGLHMAYSPAECLTVSEKLGIKKPSPQTIIALPDSGYFGLRSANNLFLIDCGKVAPDFLPAHGHGDILAFEWSVSGKRVIVDTGTYEYHPTATRFYSRSTKAHNTVTLDDRDQCEFYGSFRCGHRAQVDCLSFDSDENRILLTGQHDGYEKLDGKPVHQRTFVVSENDVEITDIIIGGSGQRVQSRILLAPEFTVSQCGGEILISDGETDISLSTHYPINFSKASWFPDFGVGIETTQITIDYSDAPCEASYRLQVKTSNG